MDTWRRILRAVLLEDGAPSMFSGLAIGAPGADRQRQYPNSATESEKKGAKPAPRTTERP